MMGHFLNPSGLGEVSCPLPQPLPAAPSLRLVFNLNWRDGKPTLWLLKKLRWSLSPRGKEWGESSPGFWGLVPREGRGKGSRQTDRGTADGQRDSSRTSCQKPRGNEDTASAEVPESKQISSGISRRFGLFPATVTAPSQQDLIWNRDSLSLGDNGQRGPAPGCTSGDQAASSHITSPSHSPPALPFLSRKSRGDTDPPPAPQNTATKQG